MKAFPMHAATVRWLALAVAFATLPHATVLPLWVSALVVAAVALRVALGRPAPRWILVPVVFAAFAAVLLQFRSISGTTAGGAFFTAMVALKFLEARDLRDAGLLACLSYFQATSIFLTSQSIGMAAYVLGSITLTTVALTSIAAPAGPPARLRWRTGTTLLLQALPIMLVLFLLFPRLSSPLWGLGPDDNTGRTGLSDTMAPGSITRLTESSEVAFRVQFDGSTPPRDRLYWRGPVLWQFDGRTWSHGKPRTRQRPSLQVDGRRLRYTLILEPHGRRWLFGLDLPLSAAGVAQPTIARNLLTDEPVESVKRFRMTSALDYRLGTGLPDPRRARALALPDRGAARARDLAGEWRAAATSARGIVDRALRFFRTREFVYTLSPPPLNSDPVDDFLFDTRAGFCEHYASAFVVLMRAAGVPARVVTGYLGGEINDLGNYLIVRQSDAHAWAEVWLEGQGWTRVDPTSAVSAERVERGISGVSGADVRLPLLSRGDAGWIKQLALAWDSVNHEWNRLVLGYGPELQRRFLANIGLGAIGRYTLAGVTAAGAVAAFLAVWLLLLRERPAADPVRRAWQRVTRRLERAGVAVDPTEGPRELRARVARERPDIAPELDPIAELYIALRYRSAAHPKTPVQLLRASRRFRPRARRRNASAQAQSTEAARSGRTGAGKWWPRRRQ